MQQARSLFWVRWHKAELRWVIESSNPSIAIINPDFHVKQTAVARARSICNDLAYGAKPPVLCELMVCRRNGTIQYKHTYPRWSDPKGSKG